ncbi:hypothetical protein [Aquimarina mytili]|uniref:Uncharacterized protein n=1 Tax=Aquimarina mytili TaxID=874423 RepID=A0A937D800_9FLAO|nr:hypothetical protein [Aquimarina mytili]MBL0683590.1 hypothetical protein [Aquimarina mytili]
MKTEIAFTILFIIGLIFNFFDWPASGIILIISLIPLATIYFFAAFYFFCDKTIKKSNIALSIISGFLLSIVPVGILFKLQNWPGAEVNLLSGIITGVILLPIIWLLKVKASNDLLNYYKSMIIRTTVLTFTAIFFYVI